MEPHSDDIGDIIPWLQLIYLTIHEHSFWLISIYTLYVFK